MKRKTKGKLDCKELDKGLRMNEHTLDALVTPGHYKIGACDVTPSEGFPEDVSQGRLSAYLEVTSTNHSSDRLKDNAIGQVLTVTDSNGVTNIYTRNRTNSNGINIWSEWSGVGGKSAGDIMDGAITAQKLSSDIRSNVVSPLRRLFIAAGAEYNDTDKVIIKTAPWGTEEKWTIENDGSYTYSYETNYVEHLPKCYYLNGLGDITEEEMIEIYNTGKVDNFSGESYCNGILRTNIGRIHTADLIDVNWLKLCFYSEIEVFSASLLVPPSFVYIKCLRSCFHGASKLSHILGIIYTKSTTTQRDLENIFKGCSNLKTVFLRSIHKNLVLSDSPLIEKKSILFIIQNANPTTAITITLHPDAYERIESQDDIKAALEEKNTALAGTGGSISLVSA